MKCSFWISNMSRLDSIVFCGIAEPTGKTAKFFIFERFKRSCTCRFRVAVTLRDKPIGFRTWRQFSCLV